MLLGDLLGSASHSLKRLQPHHCVVALPNTPRVPRPRLPPARRHRPCIAPCSPASRLDAARRPASRAASLDPICGRHSPARAGNGGRVALRLRHRILPSPPSTGSGHPQGVQCQPALLSNLEPAARRRPGERCEPGRSARAPCSSRPVTGVPPTAAAYREVVSRSVGQCIVTPRSPGSAPPAGGSCGHRSAPRGSGGAAGRG